MTSKSKTLAGLGMRTLDEYVDSLPAHEQQPVIDDTFNDDTPAQTFGVLENMRKIICLHCGLGYQLYHNRVSIERDGMCRKCFDKANASKMRLIGIAGPARAGKDTLASYLLDNSSDDWARKK